MFNKFNNLGNLFKRISFTNEDTLYHSKPETSPGYLTQSELQQVQDVMRERLHKLEVIRSSFILAAKGYKLDGHKDTSEIYYDEAAKIKKRIKSLAAIQAKLKQSIITLG